ncbi:ABC transporter substrate-binding protein [Microbacterium sp. AK031]|uniref:ABC transporter substrate-binding protein n=1 Tax=Microbacterium sp. AK031 TaxID=2723076 RepID=UPI00216982F2|nr:extracellular solute-binding protein [Microbacterium sp. AK031]MCS3843567.1 raffinose/stachyose/melibiose transport system substrate-binding protein [Microbacterium sp. AK031]
MKSRRTPRALLASGFALLTVASLVACSSGSADAGGDAGSDPESFTVLSANENQTMPDVLNTLAAGACKAENEALPLEHETVAQADVVQKVTLLASQDSLPSHFIGGTQMVRPDGDLGTAGLVLDYEDALTDLGVWEQVLPAAASTIENVYGQMVSLPYQYNLEGIFYNKQIFAEVGIGEPQTFDELLDANDKLIAAGFTPMAEAGAAAWPVTRLIGMYAYRLAGPDAMSAIQDGDAKLTDPEYVEAAQAVADLAADGAFGEGFISMDPAAATNAFLTGKAAMKYDGTWLLSNINSEDENKIGADNIGFMPFPAVEGGEGSIDQWPANAGTAFAMTPKTYGPKTADWLKCIAENYGSQALSDAGVISGFKVDGEVADLPAPTKMIQEKVAEVEETVLWFEALMDGKSTSLAQSNMSLLVSGQLSAEDYMAQLQQSIDENS